MRVWWRPKSVYTVTDPPIKLFRRFIPPLRVGAIAIDFGFALTMLLCFVLLAVTRIARRLILRHAQGRDYACQGRPPEIGGAAPDSASVQSARKRNHHGIDP